MEHVGVGSLPLGTGQVCRTCLADAADALSWHETVSQHGYTATILDMLEWLGFIVSNEEKEEYPDAVCQSCTTKLMSAYQFKLMCADASATLASLPPPQELPINFDNLTDLEIIQLDHGYDLPFPNFCPEAIDDLNLDSENDNEMKLTTDSRTTVKKRVKKIKKKQQYPCTLCPRTYSRSSNLQDHLATHSDCRDHMCVQCGKAFHSLSLLRQHSRSHSSERPHACTMCDKRYNKKQRLKEHVRVAHSNERHSQKCLQCGKVFTAKSTLIAHMKIHTGRRDFKCDVCTKAFTRAAYLKIHKLSHSDKERLKNFPCTHEGCDRSFSTKYSVGVHLAHAHDQSERYFECDICQRRFVTSSGLRQHRETHAVTFVTCNVCGRALSSNHTLRRHLRLHQENQSKIDSANSKMQSESDVTHNQISME